MAELKVGTATEPRKLSSVLETFRLRPQEGVRFPDYLPGQYIALRRDRCRLTKRIAAADGGVRYVPDLDPAGQQKIGPVTHSYSIASAPFETERARVPRVLRRARKDRGRDVRALEQLLLRDASSGG